MRHGAPRAPLLHKLRCLWSRSRWRRIMRLASITTALPVQGEGRAHADALPHVILHTPRLETSLAAD